MEYLTVSAINKYIRYLFNKDNHLMNVYIKGEISNYRPKENEHRYFTLKDKDAQISAVMFKNIKTDIKLKDGMKVLVTGYISVYEKTGTYQLYVQDIKEEGLGDLYAKFLKLQEDLKKAGYFDQKRSLPKYPKTVGVITSLTGAVIEDIKNVIKNRYPLAQIMVYPSLVQGEQAKYDLVRQIEKANQDDKADVLIIGRGGGSIEDLWAFNEKEVALALFQSKIPVISAVGHQTDFTIADFVADFRAETPSAAAVLATPDIADLFSRLNNLQASLTHHYKHYLLCQSERLNAVEKRIAVVDPKHKLEGFNLQYHNLVKSLQNNVNILMEINNHRFSLVDMRLKSFNMKELLDNRKQSVDDIGQRLKANYLDVVKRRIYLYENLVNRLKNLNPLLVMEKGFSIVYKEKQVIRDSDDLSLNDLIDIKLHKGSIVALVKEVKK